MFSIMDYGMNQFVLASLLIIDLLWVIYLVSLHPKKIKSIKECKSYCVISIIMLYISICNLIFTCPVICFYCVSVLHPSILTPNQNFIVFVIIAAVEVTMCLILLMMQTLEWTLMLFMIIV
jgi:hypothetical protein